MQTETCQVSGNPNPPRILYGRHTDGGDRVEVLGADLYRVTSTGCIYTSARSLLQNLTGHPKARNWSFDRYFRLGRFARPGGGEVAQSLLTISPPGGQTVSEGITVATPRRLGIDLDNRAHEVQKLLFAGFGSKIFAAGYDPDDVLQEVYKGILARNRGKCPWDERKSSFGHYVHMVCGCILANYHRRENRRRSVEQVGLPARRTLDYGERFKNADRISEVAEDHALFHTEGRDIPRHVVQDLERHLRSVPGRGPDKRLAVRLIPMVRAGATRAEMSETMGVSKAHVGRAVAFLKTEARNWVEG